MRLTSWEGDMTHTRMEGFLYTHVKYQVSLSDSCSIDRVSYVSFLEPFKPLDQTYRIGNNMGSLLSHRGKDVTEELKVSVL